MEHRTIPLLVLVWLLLLAMAGAIWLFLSGTLPTEFRPRDRSSPPAERTERGAETAVVATWTLSGRVAQPNGAGIEAAQVDVAGHRVLTNGRGQFTVPDLAWADHDVAAWKAGYRLETRRVSPGDRPEIRLRPQVTLHGVVRLPGGTPLPGHCVVLREHDGSETETRTDAGGAFVFERIPVGEVIVRAVAHADARGGFLTTYSRFHASAGRAEPVEIEMRPGAVFWGNVTDPEGQPVAGAHVYATYYRLGTTTTVPATSSDESGRFGLVVPQEQKCSVIVETPTPEDGWRFVRWYRHDLLPGDDPLDVQLRAGDTISGRLEAPRGVEVEGRRISAFRIAGNQRNLVTFGMVKPDGTFRIGGLWEAKYELRVSGAEPVQTELVCSPTSSFASGTTDAVLRLHRARAFGGRVLDPDGNPLAFAEVFVRNTELGWYGRVRSKRDGTFELLRVPPVALLVDVRPGGDIRQNVECGTWRSGDTHVELRLPPR